MYSFVVDFAEIVFKVNCLYSETKAFCKDYLSDSEFKYEVFITKNDIEREDERTEIKCSNQYLERLALQRKVSDLLINEKILLFHSSVIEVNGEAYVFTAPSGTGKSTHTRLWREYLKKQDVHMVNDDKPFIRIGNEIVAYGTPWKGKEGIGENRKAKIKAICFLSQGNTNEICMMEKKNILPSLLGQTYLNSDRNKLVRTICLLQKIADDIPICKMECNTSQEAAKLSFEYMARL